MLELVNLGLSNLLTPMILCFALGLLAALLRSDLEIPEALGRGMALYLMLAIGMKGGFTLAEGGAGLEVLAGLLVAGILSFAMPFVAFPLLRLLVGLDQVHSAAVAAHYGSISVVTFVTAVQFLDLQATSYEGYLVAMMAMMETPAIISGLILARRSAMGTESGRGPGLGLSSELLREILVNASVVVLVGGFVIGWATGDRGAAMVKPFIQDPFNGVLCLFLLDMGLLAARQMRSAGILTPRAFGFGVAMPLIGAGFGLGFAALLGLSLGGATLLAVLAASASYIAVPAAMRLALPEANPAVYVTLSLVITFPFNVVFGIPIYFGTARLLGFS